MLFTDPKTKKHLDYKKWCLDNKIHALFGIDIKSYGEIIKKRKKRLYESVKPEKIISAPAELDDLIRLHFLARKRKVTTILEFGVGKSTVVFADALQKNKEEFGEFVGNNLRRANPFEIHSVDSSKKWIDQCKKIFPQGLLPLAHFSFSEVEMTTFNGRGCTMYKKLPNICPDLIYLDGPDLFSVKNTIRGVSTASSDRTPMSADILFLEPFLLPGTLIVVDGRTANARFLKNNFQRDWKYQHYIKEDIHTFELIEKPLGKFNARQLRFCLGDSAM